MTQRNTIVLLLFILTVWLFPPDASAEKSCLGFKVPHTAVKVGDNRYKLTKPWEFARKFYRRTYRGVSGIKRTTSVVIPGVQSLYYENRNKGGRWAGANVSDIHGTVYVYCWEKEEKVSKTSRKRSRPKK